jgi:hypothetical protein
MSEFSVGLWAGAAITVITEFLVLVVMWVVGGIDAED